LAANEDAGLPRPESNDAANGIVGRDADGNAVAWYHFDAEAPHPPAQLRENLVTCVALDTIQPSGMDGDHSALHVNEIVFAQ